MTDVDATLRAARDELVRQRDALDVRIAGIDAALGVTLNGADRIEREDDAYLRHWEVIRRAMPDDRQYQPSEIRKATGLPLDVIRDALSAAQRQGEARRIFKRWVTIRPGEGVVQ